MLVRPNIVLMIVFVGMCGASPAHSQAPIPDVQFPYSFTNFVWFTEAELRAELKKRIPGLSVEIAPFSPAERRVRNELIVLLKQKGVAADVISIDPSPNANSQIRVAEAPKPSIAFSVVAPPHILIKSLIFENAPPDTILNLSKATERVSGSQYNANAFWATESQVRDTLAQTGYLKASVSISPGPFEKNADRFLVPLRAEVLPGAQYHVANVSADGGLLTKERDLSPYFNLRVGDVATSSAFGRLEGALRYLYWQAGYSDVSFRDAPSLDDEHALATYRLEVVTGAVYHLHSLTIEHLSPEQELKVRALLALQPTDVYDETALSRLSQTLREHKSEAEMLRGYDFTFAPRKDTVQHFVDLTLTFFKD